MQSTKLNQFAREELKSDLANCTKEQQNIFKEEYGHYIANTVEEALEIPIDDIVDAISDEVLDLAIKQFENTLEKMIGVNMNTCGQCRWAQGSENLPHNIRFCRRFPPMGGNAPDGTIQVATDRFACYYFRDKELEGDEDERH